MVQRRRTRRIKAKDIPGLKAELLKKQGYACALCTLSLRQAPGKDICLDHDHGTGRIRAVLCRNCNGCEGRIRNLANRAKRGGTILGWLRCMIEYHERHKANPLPLLHPTYRTEEEKRLRRNKRAAKRRKAKKGHL